MKTRSFSLPIAALIFAGCATHRPPPPVQRPAPLSLAQIKEMSAKDVSEETILGALRASRTVYLLGAEDVKDLLDAKVSKPVIDYLMSTPQLYRPPPRYYRYRSYYYPPPYWWDWHHDLDFHHHGHH